MSNKARAKTRPPIVKTLTKNFFSRFRKEQKVPEVYVRLGENKEKDRTVKTRRKINRNLETN